MKQQSSYDRLQPPDSELLMSSVNCTHDNSDLSNLFYPKGFSIICVYNNRQKLIQFLLASLKNQLGSFEIIAVDNRMGIYRSAPKLLNEIARKAYFDTLLFVHQDVSFTSSSWLVDVQETLNTLGHYGAAGVAGSSSSGVKSCVWHGCPPLFSGGEQCDRPIRVQTLDGCLLIVQKSTFVKTGFDENTCDGWHLYVADYCLDLGRISLPIYVLPHRIYHESTGPKDPATYESSLKKLLKKHNDHVANIHLTIGNWVSGSL